MFKKKQKKGFTIVELVIVIAVVAILAAILIPTFAGLIKKAQISSDQTLVRNLNTSLAISEGGTTTNKTMYQTLEDMKAQGYSVEKLTPTHSKNDVVWDSENNQFVLVYEDGTTYTGTTVDATSDSSKLWKIYFGITDVNSNTKYSAYLAGTGLTGDVVVKGVGFDAGVNTGLKVKYEGNSKDVIIRTNGGTLTVDAENDTVNHFGDVDEVTLTKVKTYNEFGSVTKSALNIESGKVQIKVGAFVNKVVLPEAGASLDISSSSVVRSISGNSSLIGQNPNGVKTVTEEQKTEVTTKVNQDLSNLGKIFNIVSKGNYTETEFLTALTNAGVTDVNLYYVLDYEVSVETLDNIEVDGMVYKSDSAQKYSMGNGAILSANVFKIVDGKLAINKITYFSALVGKQVLKVNGKIISLVEDSYDVDMNKSLKITSVSFSNSNDGVVTPVSSNEYDVIYNKGQTAGRISVKVEGVEPGDFVIIKKDRTDSGCSYSYDSYNQDNDFGIYAYNYGSVKESTDLPLRHTATYAVFDKTTKEFKGTFTITLNCSVKD